MRKCCFCGIECTHPIEEFFECRLSRLICKACYIKYSEKNEGVINKVDYNKKRVEAYEYFVDRFREHVGSYWAAPHIYNYSEFFEKLIDCVGILERKLTRIDMWEKIDMPRVCPGCKRFFANTPGYDIKRKICIDCRKKEGVMFGKVSKKEFEEFKKEINEARKIQNGDIRNLTSNLSDVYFDLDKQIKGVDHKLTCLAKSLEGLGSSFGELVKRVNELEEYVEGEDEEDEEADEETVGGLDMASNMPGCSKTFTLRRCAICNKLIVRVVAVPDALWVKENLCCDKCIEKAMGK
jgi:hypothetical protein